MKSRYISFALSATCFLLIGACNKPADFTGFWKANCTDAFGVQIKKQPGNLFSVSFCGPGGCTAPGEWAPNTAIIRDLTYRVVNSATIEIKRGERSDRYTRCTTDTNPPLDYATMRSADHDSNGGVVPHSEPMPETASVQFQEDPHRPACTKESCKQIEAFVRKHYCGGSPAGNGPDDGCDLRIVARKPGANVNALADFECDWNEKKEEFECHQKGQPPSTVRDILMRELRRLGLPASVTGTTTFNVWKSTLGGPLIAAADYERVIGSDIELCQVIVAIEGDSRVTVLRKVPFQKTDADVPTVTQWSLVDLADVDGDGNIEIILEGDAYEDHWLEVVSVRDGTVTTKFSGLGYYL